ncbi:thioredoxin domain-containing protein 11-like [Tubulanus polymorphus]|uniref:thioredoxin domain-containing protein 11-like n=1 Tax=Tubulanus polymorphus TaxID=672921 RepID=UPI003DA67A49
MAAPRIIQQFASRIYRTMARNPDICCVLLTIVLIFIAQKSSARKKNDVIREQPLPKKFFHPSIPVIENQYGGLDVLGDRLEKEGLLFVMYYAPWCAKSMEVRWEFGKAAQYMHDQITFAAVNCWWPTGQCRKKYKFYSYPVIFLYHTTLNGFRYNSHLTADHMVVFLERYLLPLVPLHSVKQIAQFISEQDNSVIGYFDFNASPQPPGFIQYYYAALRMFERYPIHLWKFGVITSPNLASKFGISSAPSIFLFRLLNETLQFPIQSFNNTITSSALVEWLIKYAQKVTALWLAPSGEKSVALFEHIGSQPALIIFLNNNPFYVDPYFSMLRELGLEYRVMPNNSADTNNIVGYIKSAQLEQRAKQETLRTTCRAQNHEQITPTISSDTYSLTDQYCCISLRSCEADPRLTRDRGSPCSATYDVCKSSPISKRVDDDDACDMSRALRYFRGERRFFSYCREQKLTLYRPHEITRICRRDSSRSESIVKRFAMTDSSSLLLATRRRATRCKRLRFIRSFGHPAFSPIIREARPNSASSNYANFTGLANRTNKTVNFFVFDRHLYRDFAQRLNIPVPKSTNVSVVLLDIKNEAQHVMNEPVNRINIKEFVVNFTSGYLRRHLRSSSSSVGRNSNISSQTCSLSSSSTDEVCVADISSANFRQTVMDNEKDVVVLYYSHWCGHCTSNAHNFLKLAKYFKSAKNITFVRINMYKNDLPWPFTVDRYPSMIIYPAKRKSESVTFPGELVQNLSNMIQFVLEHCSRQLKVETLLGMCNRACIERNLASITKQIRVYNKDIAYLQSRVDSLSKIVASVDELKAALLDKTDGDAKMQSTVKEMFSLENDLRSQEWDLRVKQAKLKAARRLYKALKSASSHVELHKLTTLLLDHEKAVDLVRREKLRYQTSSTNTAQQTAQLRDEL